MAHIQAFGTLAFKTVSPDEVARTAYYALCFGVNSPSVDDGAKVQEAVRAVLPILGTPQLALLLHALDTPALDRSWRQLEADIKHLAE